jgi:hypothetical protein
VLNSTASVSGSGRIFSARYNWHLPRIGELSQRISWPRTGAISTAASCSTTHPAIRCRASSRTRSPCRGAATGATICAKPACNVSVARNLQGGEHGRDEDFNIAAAGANARFAVMRAGASWFQLLPRDWRDPPAGPGAIHQGRTGIGRTVRRRRCRFAARTARARAGQRPGLACRRRLRHACLDIRHWVMRGVLFGDVAHLYRVNPLPGENFRRRCRVGRCGPARQLFHMAFRPCRLRSTDRRNAGAIASGSHRVHASFSLSF